jgi:hypothetical protein
MDLASGQPPAWVHSGRMYRGRCAAVARLAVSPSAVAELRYRRHVMTAPAARRTISHAGPGNWLIRPLGPFAALGSRRDFGA